MGNHLTVSNDNHAIEELAKCAEQYKSMISTNLFGFWIADASGRILEVNDTYCRMSGYSRDELLQLSIWDVEAVESADETVRHIEHLTTAISDQFESRHRAKNGRIYDVEISTSYLRSQGRIIAFFRDISDRRQAEEALRDSEARYHAIIEDLTELICRYLPDGRISFVNEAYARYFGINRNDIMYHNFVPHVPEPDLSRIKERIEAITSESPVTNVEHRVIMPDGTVRWQEWSHRGIFSPESAVVEYQAVGRDITERKRAEDELLERNRFLDTLLEAIPVPIFFKDRDARYIGFNKSYEEFYGKTRKELIGKSVFDIAPRELAEIYHSKDSELLTNGGSQVYESKVIDACGSERSVIFHKAAFWGNENEVNGLIGAVLDITERKEAENALQESRGTLKAYMDNSIDVIFALNAEGVFLFVSRAWERHFGYSVSEVLDKNFALFVHPDDVEPCVRYLKQILCGGKSKASPPYRVKRIDGSWRMFIANGSRCLDKYNEWQFIGVAHDVTDQYEVEEQLRQAKDAADTANQAKSAFLATMSHEIRTPLNALLGNLELLASSNLVPKQQEYLKDCQAASHMLLQVINDVLDFSKIEAGKFELTNEVFSVSSMARQLSRIFTGSAAQKGIKFNLILGDDLPGYIYSDEHRLRQIISNLLSNAIKFTSQGMVSLEIMKKRPNSRQNQNSDFLLFSIRDTGSGIPQDKHDLIFDSFTQVENFTTRRHAGTGLGLAICRRLSEMMGGTISLTSVPGQGSVFNVALPVTVCVEPPQQVKSMCVKSYDATPRHILLADDDELGRNVTAALLQRRGHQVAVVANGTCLLEALQQKKFDIILSDISMPDMDGLQVARIIRSGDYAGIDTTIPIIAMTAHAFDHDRARFLDAGINGHASKPVNFEELLRKIDVLCSKPASDPYL